MLTGILLQIALGAATTLYAWVSTSTGLWYCGDILDPTPTWACVMTDAAATALAGYNGTFGGLGLVGTTIYAAYNGESSSQGAYFWGNAGGVSAVSFPQIGSCKMNTGTVATQYNVYSDGTTARFACDGGSCARGRIYTIGGSYSAAFASQSLTTVWKGYTLEWSPSRVDVGYEPGSVYDTDPFHAYGIDVIADSIMYGKANTDLYRDKMLIATSQAVWGSILRGGRAIFHLNPDQIIWVTGNARSSGNYIVYTDDAFGTYVNKNGDWDTAIPDYGGQHWGGGPIATGNALTVVFEY